jgi:hypothetical protein
MRISGWNAARQAIVQPAFDTYQALKQRIEWIGGPPTIALGIGTSGITNFEPPMPCLVLFARSYVDSLEPD